MNMENDQKIDPVSYKMDIRGICKDTDEITLSDGENVVSPKNYKKEDITTEEEKIDIYNDENEYANMENLTKSQMKALRKRQENFWDYCEIGDINKLKALFDDKSFPPLKIDEMALDNWTGLHFASNEGHEEVVKYLISKNANIEAKTGLGRRPIHIATIRGNLNVVKILLDSGADINSMDNEFNTPLHHACEFEYGSIIDYLLEGKPKINIKNNKGVTAIDICSNISSRKKFEDLGLINDDPIESYGKVVFGNTVRNNARFNHVENLLFLSNQNRKINSAASANPEKKETSEKATDNKNVVSPKLDENKEKTQIKTNNTSSNTKSITKVYIYSESSSDLVKDKKLEPADFVYYQLLGKGSFGEVYYARKKSDGKAYAVKILDKSKVLSQNLLKYAQTERNVLSLSNHPFMVKLNYAFQTKNRLFLVMDYIPGGDLNNLLNKKKRVSEEVARLYVCEVLLALEELHKNLIIFRDLKPDNVVIDGEGHVLLTDFGLSKQGIEKNLSKSFCGSIAYLPPEMLEQKGHGRAVDWYLLGVLFYELIVGLPPYFSKNRDELFRNIKSGPLLMPKNISEEGKSLIRMLLNRKPSERLGSKRDSEEVKEHPWFKDVNWQEVYERKLRPPKPDLNIIGELPMDDQDYIIKEEKPKSVRHFEGWTFVAEDLKKI